MEQIADVMKNKEVYEKLGVRTPRGLLLHGDPGVGKTLMANSLIDAGGRQAFLCRKDKPNGAFVNEIKSTFEKAAENAPSIIFLDDIDKFANGDIRHRDSEEYVTVQSCIDELGEADVFVLATANNIKTMPHSLLRPGRFDRVIKISAPHGDDTEKITMEHFMKACLKTIYHVSNNALEDGEPLNEMSEGNSLFAQIAYHEAGHAIISELLSPGSVSLISVHNQNGHFGGFTAHSDNLSFDPVKRKKIQIISALGGRAAIEQKYGTVDGGAEADLDRAFSLTKDPVVKSCSCGLHLHCDVFGDTQELRVKQEQAVIDEVEKYYCQANIMIAANMAYLDKLAGALMQKGYLIQPEIRAITNGMNRENSTNLSFRVK